MERYKEIGSFTLGKNTYKREGDKTPDYTGTMIMEDGSEQRLGAWLQTNGKTGEKFFSGKITIDTESSSKSTSEVISEVEDIPF